MRLWETADEKNLRITKSNMTQCLSEEREIGTVTQRTGSSCADILSKLLLAVNFVPKSLERVEKKIWNTLNIPLSAKLLYYTSRGMLL